MANFTLKGDTLAEQILSSASEERSENLGGEGLELEVEHSFQHI